MKCNQHDFLLKRILQNQKYPPYISIKFNSLNVAIEDEILKIISKAPTKSYSLEPTTWLKYYE